MLSFDILFYVIGKKHTCFLLEHVNFHSMSLKWVNPDGSQDRYVCI
jgi:hypothetical protein